MKTKKRRGNYLIESQSAEEGRFDNPQWHRLTFRRGERHTQSSQDYVCHRDDTQPLISDCQKCGERIIEERTRRRS